MKWSKRGLIYCPDGSSSWAKHSALTPTPILMDEGTIRVYASFRDDAGVGRIGYVDLDASNPSRVLRVSERPVLDVGIPGAFDDNGVILGDVVAYQDSLRMYYVGFQLVQKVKFLAFTGLAVSDDGGESFIRHSQAPVLDRSDEGIYIRAIHSVLHEAGRWRVWYAADDGWEHIDGTPYPRYAIYYMESDDGIRFPQRGRLVVNVRGAEYRIGRPRVVQQTDGYRMFYTRGTLQGDYIAGCATSVDGVTWTRTDGELGIGLSEEGWDSRSLAYPSILSTADRVYMFYNGNDMGRTGFGYAVLEQW